jgi:pimeloyl-[acyl-carrier protein] methyl ester esterase
MKLRARVSGTGPDIVLLHGWALHAGVWRDTAQGLSAHHRVTTLDLPGHGRSEMPDGGYTLPRLAEAVVSAVPRGCTLVGWSFGGLVGLQIALEFKGVVDRLVLVDSSPQFVASPKWPHGLRADVLDNFSRQLRQDYHGTISRFLALQVLDAEDARRTLERLREQMASAPAPDPRALEGGLAILRHASLAARLHEIKIPVTIVQGRRDTLVPAAAAEAMAQRLTDASVHVIRGAGHAPFLSHPDVFRSIIDASNDARST